MNSENTISENQTNDENSETLTESEVNGEEQMELIVSELKKIDKWEEIGAHRPIGQLWYNLGIYIIIILLSAISLATIVSWVFPYPEIQGYYKIADNFFLLIYQVFDIGTAFGIERFIGEWRVKDTKRMIKYVQFFFWYQMMTGLVQLVIITIVVMKWMVYTNLAYLSWLFLLIVARQYPAMSKSLKNTLNGLQRYDKGNLMNLFTNDVFKQFLMVGFIIIGRKWGQANPAYGELFGATIGVAAGAYIAEFFAIGIGGYWFHKAMKTFGFSFWDAFKVGFDKKIVKECMWFGLQVSIVPSINTLTTTWMLVMYLDALPQYATWIFIAEIAKGISSAINMGQDFKLTPAIAEAYPNGKEELTQFYVQTSIKWQGFFMMLLLTIIGGFVPPILGKLTAIPELAQYSAATIFIPFAIIQSLFTYFIDLPNPVLVGTLHVGFYTFLRVSEEVFQVFFVWLFLYVLRLHETLGLVGIGIIFGWEHFFPRLIKMTMGLIYINKKIFKIKVPWMQSFIVTGLAALPNLLFAFIWNSFILDPLINLAGLYVALAITLLLGIIALPLLIYLPLTGILGGWDDYQLKIFKKSISLSGITKVIVRPFYKMVQYWTGKSPWHNKFMIPHKKAEEQIKELHIMKAKQEYVVAEKEDQSMALIGWIKDKIKDKSE
ncbi:MAG: hypothetical protein GF364_07170 [Candidatus Lokiarchaeota archaeon]|nr:hypothetical protein [Candidatus Lokiarchaeota archaeon]